jgi:hypothetical protein
VGVLVFGGSCLTATVPISAMGTAEKRYGPVSEGIERGTATNMTAV